MLRAASATTDAPKASGNLDGAGALDRALDLLDAIGDAPEGLSQAALAEQLVLPRTTVYRLLGTLVDRGLVRRDPLRRVFCLGFRCFEMARRIYAMSDLVSAAAVELRTLRDLTGETAYLAVLEGNDVVGLERVDGAHSQRSQAVLGQRKPVYCTSQGKAILSAMGAEARDAIVKDLTLRPLTPLTITDRRRLNAELKVTAARGYAIDDEEIVLGVRCVGAPILDSQGLVRGAISVAGPAHRLTPARLELLGPEVAEAGRRVGAQLKVASSATSETAVRVIEGAWAFQGGHPRWSVSEQKLYWADSLAPSLHVADGNIDRARLDVERPIVGLVLLRGQVWLAHEHGIEAIDATSLVSSGQLLSWPALKVLAMCEGDAGDSAGEGSTTGMAMWVAVAGAENGTVVGSMDVQGNFSPRWQLKETVQCLRWHHAENALVATAPESGELLRLQPGQASVRRLATVPKGSGRISGLAFDRQGGIWTALCDGWGVVRFLADGTLDRVVGVPVPCPSDVEVGGPDLDTLYVTSARHPVALDALQDAPLSGRLFAVGIKSD